MSIEQSWRIARLQAENARLYRDTVWLDAYRQRCRSLACSCLIAEGCCEDAACRASSVPRDWCDEALALAEPD